jgi:hypothetical protein
VFARPAAATRLIALAEVDLLGKALFHQIIDAGMESFEAPQLLALELGK